jgi:hypothetical protein
MSSEHSADGDRAVIGGVWATVTMLSADGSTGANRSSHVVAAQAPGFRSVNRRTRMIVSGYRQRSVARHPVTLRDHGILLFHDDDSFVTPGCLDSPTATAIRTTRRRAPARITSPE